MKKEIVVSCGMFLGMSWPMGSYIREDNLVTCFNFGIGNSGIITNLKVTESEVFPGSSKFCTYWILSGHDLRFQLEAETRKPEKATMLEILPRTTMEITVIHNHLTTRMKFKTIM
jgi:hypothetical protein